MKYLVIVVVNALALGVAAWLFHGINLTDTKRSDQILTLLIVGAIFGVVNAIIRPIVNLLSLPLIVLTLGLMLVVVNALMLLLTSKIADGLDVGFVVSGFWTAVFGSIVISFATMVIESILPGDR